MLEYNMAWQIPNAGPAVSTFHFDADLPGTNLASLQSHIWAFFDSLKGALPNDVTIVGETEVRQIDEVTGQLQAVGTVVPNPNVTGTVTGGWAGGSGCRFDWQTTIIRFGRRVRGRTYIVPLAAGNYDASGNVSAAVRADFIPKAQSLLSNLGLNSTPMCVYSRPQPGRPGLASPVISVNVPPLAAQLRSRKQ